MIRFVFRWLFRGVVLLIVLGTALYLLKDQLLREWVVYRLRTVTGLETRLDSLRSEFLGGTLTLGGLQIFNSADFGGSPLLTVPDLHVQVDTGALAHREFRLQLARLHLAEFNVIRNQRGETNLVALLDSVSRRANAGDAAAVSPPGFEFTGIDTLNLTMGVVRFAQLGPGGGTREIQVGLTNEIVRNVRSTQDLMPLVLRVAFREVASGLRTETRPPVVPPGPPTGPAVGPPTTPRPAAPPTAPRR